MNLKKSTKTILVGAMLSISCGSVFGMEGMKGSHIVEGGCYPKINIFQRDKKEVRPTIKQQVGSYLYDQAKKIGTNYGYGDQVKKMDDMVQKTKNSF